MKKHLICAALSSAIVAGCGSKTDANEKNFSAVIADELKKGAICLPFDKWPYRVVASDTVRMGQLAVLETAGLVSGADFEADEQGFLSRPTGRKIKLKIFSLTEEGKKFFRENDTAKAGAVGIGNLCYAKFALVKVIKWESPTNQKVNVTFTSKFDSFADWATKPEFQAVFPGAAAVNAKTVNERLAGIENKIPLKLTNIGWEPDEEPLGIFGKKNEIFTPDTSSMNPADNLPVATPVVQATAQPISPSVPNSGNNSPSTTAVSINGNWQGTYESHGHAPIPFSMVISNLNNGVFDGSASEQIASAGVVETIPSKLMGTLNTTAVSFTKEFTFKGKSYSVQYTGAYDPATKRIQGKWKGLTGHSHGSFLVWR